MTPSQEAREYPVLPEPAIGFPWRINAKDGVAHSAGYTADQMRSYVDSDRKARQQEAQRLIDAVDKLGNARAFLRGWQAHGVVLTAEQATELLCEALGVEVEIRSERS